MPLEVWDGSSWRTLVSLEVWDPSTQTWRQASQAWVWNGSEWKDFLTTTVYVNIAEALVLAEVDDYVDEDEYSDVETFDSVEVMTVVSSDRTVEANMQENLSLGDVQSHVDTAYPIITAVAQDEGECPDFRYTISVNCGPAFADFTMTLQRNDSGGGSDNWVTVNAAIDPGSQYVGLLSVVATSDTRGFRIKQNNADYTDEYVISEPLCPE